MNQFGPPGWLQCVSQGSGRASMALVKFVRLAQPERMKQLEALRHIQLPMAEILQWNSPMWFLELVDMLQDHSAEICKAPPAPELRSLKELLRFRLTNNT